MTAFHIMILSEFGDPLIPTGGSLASRLKSRIRRRLAAVDYGVSESRGVKSWDEDGVSRWRPTPMCSVPQQRHLSGFMCWRCGS